MKDVTPTFASNIFGIEINAPHGVRLVVLEGRICPNVLSESEIDSLIANLHDELDGVSAAMKTALRNLNETSLFDEDDP